MKNKILFLGLLLSFTSFAQNVLINGDFSSGLSSWEQFSCCGPTLTFNADNNEANMVNIAGTTGTTWQIQFYQELSPSQISQLTVGESYKISFDARSNVNGRTVRMFFGQDGGAFTPVNVTDFNLTDQMANYEVIFTVNATFSDMKCGFEMGQSNNPVWIDNVVLEPFSGPTAPNQPVGFVAENNFGGSPLGSGEVYLACGGNNTGGNVIYRLFYAPTASAPSDPTTATEYNFGTTTGDNDGVGPFGFVLSGLLAGTEYTFWLYQFNTADMLFSTPAIGIVTTNGTLGGPSFPAQPVGFVASSASGSGEAFLSCGANNVGGNIIYRMFYAPSASIPSDPTTATEYNFGTTANDGNGEGAFGFIISGLTPLTEYTFWLYQFNTVEMTFSSPAIATAVTGGTLSSSAPTTNAPAPTCPAADVVSVYGSHYPTNIATNYNPNWGQTGSVNPNFDPGTGNPVLAYTNFNYQGTVLTQTDLSSMEFLTFDIWTDADPTATILQVSPINQGGVAEVLVTVPFVQGEWTTIELPKAAFTGMTWNAVKELKFAANGPGSAVPVDIYLDNIFFSTCGTPIPVITGDIYINDGAFAPGDFCTAAGQDILAHDGSPALPFASLAYALTRSEQAPGDVIYIDAGNYTWSSDHVFTVSGTEAEPITIQGKGSATNVTSTSASANSSGLHFTTGSHWVVKDLNWTAANARTVLVEAAQGIILDNCNFTYLNNSTTVLRQSIFVNNAAGQLTIKNCNITRNNTAFHMIEVVAGAALTMQDNTISFPALAAVGTTSGVQVSPNASSVIIIERNKFVRGGYGVGLINSTAATAHPNSIIQNNFFTSNWGIINTGMTGLKVYHNSFRTQGECIGGFGPGLLSNWDIQNNILNVVGTQRASIRYTSTTVHPAVMDYNLYFHAAATGAGEQVTGTYLSFAAWQNAPGGPWEANGLGGSAAAFNPLFVNPGAGDLQLQLGSPAIGAGNDVGVTVDINGTARPLSGAFDIGAHEFLFIPPAPTTNAPSPTCPASGVVSVFGSTYPTNIATNYNPNWGQSGFGSANLNFDPGTGNTVLAYTNFNYQGMELTQTNLSNKEFLRFDVYTAANPSTTTLQVSPINQGTGTAEVLVTVPFVQGQWTSIALPKSAFVGMTWDAVFQLKFAANGPGSVVPIDLYLDNIYFSDDCQICETVNGVDEIASCEPITWIDGNTYSTSNNTATFLLEGAAQNGCDSLVTLNFTLLPCTQLQAGSCGATDVTPNQLLFAINVNAPQYRFRFTGNNNGGPGWNNDQFIVDRPHRYIYFNHLVPGFQFGETYNVEVAIGDGSGNFGPYGNACDVTLTNTIPTTQIQANQCGATVDGNNLIFANQIFDAQGYRFKITGPNNGGAGWDNDEFILDRPNRNFYFSWLVPGATPGGTFSVEVAYLQNDGVTYSAYGAACNITLNPQTTQIQASQCGASDIMPNALVFANQVFDAQGYRFRITGSNNGGAGWNDDVFILDRPNRNFNFQWGVPGSLAGETYEVEVAFLQNDGVTYSAYGAMCEITLFGTAEFVLNDDNEIFIDNKSMISVEFGANASHNPFTTDFGLQILNANDQEPIAISIYDMSGKLIERNAINPMDIETARFGANLAAGMYMIEVRQGSNQAVIRQVKN